MATRETLGRRALNRALLGRQLLLEREALPVPRAVARLVGLQAQEPPDPYVALWSRIGGFGHEDLADLLVQRRVVRMTLVRGTIHLVTAPDGLSMWPVMRALFERTFRGSEWGRNLDGLDLDEVLAVGRVLVSDEPRTAAQLAPPLTERWPDRDTAALVAAVRYLLPMVQVPPRGVWGQRGMPTLTTVDRWTGRPLGRTTRPDRMMMRYLQAFGPASVADMRTWSGLSGLREVTERLRPRLRTYRDEDGRELLDGPDGLFPDPDTVVPHGSSPRSTTSPSRTTTGAASWTTTTVGGSWRSSEGVWGPSSSTGSWPGRGRWSGSAAARHWRSRRSTSSRGGTPRP